jgi:ABC-type transport system involved in multi-copper enzyme maturation permease subunit
MSTLLISELKKFFKFKITKLSLLLLIVLTFLVSVAKVKSPSVFAVQVSTLKNLGSILVLSMFLSISSYIFSLEISFKSLKILRAKSTSCSKIYISKFIVGLIFSFIILLIIYIASFLIGLIKYPITGMTLNNINVSLNIKDSILFTLNLYLNQFLASAFIISLSLFIAILFQRPIVPIIFVPIITYSINSIGFVFEKTFGISSYILPVRSDFIYGAYVNNSVQQNLLSLFIYTLVFIFLGIYFLKNKEVKV